MKKVFLLVVFSCLVGCKTKALTLEKTKKKKLTEIKGHFDSIFKLSLRQQLDWQKIQSNISSKLVLSTVSLLDSSGNRKPFRYKHFVDGNLKEEIYLEGGEINRESQTKESKGI
jgi:hypothetical protein